ncbi:hypothetical protein BS78_08G148900 [Paspalum vaginatum]|nr:hypothetical protein BS78_08G148900 [Paspalum vaginatum]
MATRNCAPLYLSQIAKCRSIHHLKRNLSYECLHITYDLSQSSLHIESTGLYRKLERHCLPNWPPYFPSHERSITAITHPGAHHLPSDSVWQCAIPYPFGIGARCAATNLNRYFALTCNDSSQPPKPMFGDTGIAVEVIDISLERGEVRVYGGVSYSCFTSNTTVSDYNLTGLVLDDTPFILSATRNRFTVIGCNTLGIIGGNEQNSSDLTSDGAACTGTGCCETNISSNLTQFEADLFNTSSVWKFNPCFYAMLVEEGWYSFSRQDLVEHLGFINRRAARGVPVVNDWAVRNSSCPDHGAKSPKDYACVSSNSYSVNASDGPGYLCNCSKGYGGNPYLPEGCQDINECELRRQEDKYKELYPCENGRCHNTQGGYICKCRIGTRSDGTNSACRPVLSQAEKVVIGLSASAVVVISLAFLFVMKLQERKHWKEKDEYFKQNGGLKLYDEMRSRQVDTICILTEKEIKKATNNFSEDRVLGCGGHGMVYRGTLEDNKEVAIKKSKIIILSQINHRNIVSLLGCCLVVDVPMLVYEFISNGTLFEFLHGYDHKSPIPLDLRLRIATQSAEALAYIHSSTSRTILHGDVKSLNILLDDEYNAKVSDFGASALKSMDKNDFIMLIQGTLGYIDPESFVSQRLTDKSDIMTRKKALYIDASNEKKALSDTFIQMFHQNKLQDMFDSEIVDDEVMVVLEKLAALVMHCLSPKGEDRPTMKEKQFVTKTHPIQAHYSYEASVSVCSEETGNQSTDTARLVLEVDLAR